MKKPTIGFAGMTHLGLVSGVSASEKGFEVVCFDPDAARIAALGRKELPVSEPQLDQLVAKNAARIRFTSASADLNACEVIYVAPDVPTDDRGASDLALINDLLERVFGAAREDAVIVVLSQVPPGFTRSRQRPDRNLYYQVETLIFGRAVERALQPERYIVGCADPSQPLPASYRAFLEAHGCPILPMRYESAELAKISINFFLVSSVTTSNVLAEVCEKIGADWAEIIPALRLDRRIGPHAYLSPGLGIAGGNLERDLATVLDLAGKRGTDEAVIRSWQTNSARRRQWSLEWLNKEIYAKIEDPLVGIWGLAYKQDTHSTKNSPSLELIRNLKGRRIRVHDPAAEVEAAEFGFVRCREPSDAASGADALVVMTPWALYGDERATEVIGRMKGRLVLDPYARLNEQEYRSAGFDYRRLGC